VALVPVAEGAGLTFGVEAYSKEADWLRFGLSRDGPCPLPGTGAALLARGGDGETPGVPTGVPAGLGETDGSLDLSGFSAEPVGSFVLPKGAAADLVDSLGRSWAKAARRLQIESGIAEARIGKLELRGRAKKVKSDLDELLVK
jgi:hypothetical protein